MSLLSKITGWAGPVYGILLAAAIVGLFVFNTPTDSPWRWLGVLLGFGAFVGLTAVAISNEKRRP